MTHYIVGLIGMWLFADGIASLWTYTTTRSSGQTWLRDHSLRIFRSLCGIALMVIGGWMLGFE